MDSNQIVSQMNTYLHTAAALLSEWLGKILPKTSDEWWEESVLDRLSYNQRQIAAERGYTRLEDFDLAALLRITDKSWFELRNLVYLPSKERECVKDMMHVRNNWAHVSAELPGKDTIVTDLETIKQFFGQLGAADSQVNEVDRMIGEIKSPSVKILSEASAPDSGAEEKPGMEETEAGESDQEEVIEVQSMVYLTGEPDTRGIVMSVAGLGDTTKYEVFVNGAIRTFYTGQIAPAAQKESVAWVDIDTFRSYLTAYQINHPSGRNLYSLNSARIDFVPYQFRPALKIIHADEPRILIADSVGVGKTIEAGLIIKELQARHDLGNILIICPKPLVAERKWELEMQRFDEDFIPLNGPELRQILSDTDRDGDWPARYSRSIVPYSILDSRVYEGDDSRRNHSFGLQELDPAPHFDLVIVDEAHHIRNGSMEKEKAYAYKCVKYFCDHADAVVMLTATPLQTGSEDLYTLLNVLRPDVIIDPETFAMMSKPNEYISRCAGVVRRADANWQKMARVELEGLLETQWGENVIAANPAYTAALKTLQQEKITREERVQMITDVESLHSFHTMLNRTRRKDIQDFCIRRPYTLAVDFTPEQKALHDALLRFEGASLTQLHGNARSILFMTTTLRRQAASCIFGLAPHIRYLIGRRIEQLSGDPDSPYYDFSFESTAGGDALQELAAELLELADCLPDHDPKFDLMMTVVQEKQAFENNKIILFSSFRHTLRYLYGKLEAAGLRIGQVDGSVKEEERRSLRARFELPKEDPEAIDIMLFTEVGSEGLDYQFCNMMINYDLPWNPMRIEQRIGRIDRRGQKSETVSIYNMVTNDTVDADIYNRCLWRIGIFESSIGECEEIFGEISTQIEQIVSDPILTEEERRVKLEQMADNEVRRIQEINKLEDEEKEFFGFDLSEYVTAKEIQKAENPWLTQKNLRFLVEQYLTDRCGKGSYILGEGDVKQLRLSVVYREELRDDFRKLEGGRSTVNQTWERYLKGNSPMHKITFDSAAAERNRDAFFITSMHPLAKQAAAHFAGQEDAYIRLYYKTEDLPMGTYHFSVYAWNYLGLNPHTSLVVVCDDDVIAAELPEILQEANSSEKAVRIRQQDWDSLEQKQVSLWKKAKEELAAETANQAAFKIESLTNNFKNKKRTLEQRILENSNDKIRRMYRAELENAQENYEQKAESIRETAQKTDIHTQRIANGLLDIFRN